MSYRVVFAGNPSFATHSLKSLIKDKRFFVSTIITESDKKIGRKQILTPTPVKEIWIKNDINVVCLKNSEHLLEVLKKDKPDFFVVVAYGHILSKEILVIAKYNINIHWSQLPKYRWASPVQSALLAWDTKTWISIMNIEEKMDAWLVWKKIACDILKEDTTKSLFEKLWSLSESLPDILDDIFTWKLLAQKQDDSKTSYCKKIKKEDWRIDFQNDSAEVIFNKLRAYTPWPWIFCSFNWKNLKFTEVDFNNKVLNWRKIWEVYKHDWNYFIKTIQWSLELIEVQLEWKNPMSILDFTRGHGDFLWTILN